MIDQERIRNALGGLASWLETWRDDSGAYNGFVVHRTETKRMGRVHDTAWSQSAMIRGYGNLFRKSGEARWGKAMTDAADLLASRYDPASGRIRYTGHEDDRFQSLVSCALGICALLTIADLVDDARRERFVRIASEHARRYWFDILWVESEGAFRFSEIDSYSRHEDRFVVNFNTMAAEAMLAIYRATGADEFREKALRVGRWLVDRWNETQAFNERVLAGHTTVADDPLSCWMAPGGMSYQFTESNRDPDNYVTIYTGLSLRGLYALSRETDKEHFSDIIRRQSEYLLAMRDPDSRLFFHTARGGQIEKNPQFIAGAGMTLLGLHEVMPLIGDSAVPEDTVRAILGLAYTNGSYPNFTGKNDTGLPRRDGGGTVWEDVAATVNWNAQLFEYLTRLVEEPDRINTEKIDRAVSIISPRFFYRDTRKNVQIISWRPARSWGLYIYTKKRAKARLAICPIMIYRSLLSWLRHSRT